MSTRYFITFIENVFTFIEKISVTRLHMLLPAATVLGAAIGAMIFLSLGRWETALATGLVGCFLALAFRWILAFLRRDYTSPSKRVPLCMALGGEHSGITQPRLIGSDQAARMAKPKVASRKCKRLKRGAAGGQSSLSTQKEATPVR